MNKPIAVLTSDVHFNIQTLPLAEKALSMALSKAEELNVPLIVAGDLLDTKAIIRAECANSVIKILSVAKTEVLIMVGNHDKIHEKSMEHSLNFLRPYASIIQSPLFYMGLYFIPYQNEVEELRKILSNIPRGSILIMHQGFLGAWMGEYVVDKSSIDPKELDGYRVISGHYHRHQDLGSVGNITYIGSPYSVTFAEAHDGSKGIRVLYDNGSTEGISLGLRKHLIIERTYDKVLEPIEDLDAEDLLWLKVYGPASELDKLDRNKIATAHKMERGFKLDKIYDKPSNKSTIEITKISSDMLIDHLVDTSEETEDQKSYLKKLWREVMS